MSRPSVNEAKIRHNFLNAIRVLHKNELPVNNLCLLNIEFGKYREDEP